MTDLETAIMIKNMVRETVRRMCAKNAAKDDPYPYLEAIKGKIAAEGYKNPTEAEIKKIFANVAAPMQMTKFALEYKRRGLL